MEDFNTVRKMVEGEDAPNTEIFAEKVQLTCDISIMAYENEEGKTYYSTHLCFGMMEEEGSYEVIADLEYNTDGDKKIYDLSEAIRLLGISSDAKIWVSEQ